MSKMDDLAATRELIEAVEELLDTLTPAYHPAFNDPAYGAVIRHLGDRIGYGALMSGASAEWRDAARRNGNPAGGEFVAGPCYSVLKADYERTTKALSAFKAAAIVPAEGG